MIECEYYNEEELIKKEGNYNIVGCCCIYCTNFECEHNICNVG